MMVVSKRAMSLLPQKEAVRTVLQPFKQETEPFGVLRWKMTHINQMS